MKKSRLLLLAFGLAASASLTSRAETVAPYTLDFNTPIATTAHDFRPASNWRHLVDPYDSYGFIYYVSYSYSSTDGVDDSGYLKAGSQLIGDNYDYSDRINVNDLLVTPVINGEVSFAARLNNYDGYITVFAINEDGTKGEQLYRYSRPELNRDSWVTMTFTLASAQRIGIKLSDAGIDNFSAASAEIEIEKSLSVASATPHDCDYNDSSAGSKGTIYWFQQPGTEDTPGMVKVSYMVTVTNNGEADLTQGEENFSVSIINGKTKEAIVTTPVPQDLAIGATSEPFEVTALVPVATWPYSSSLIKMNVRENIMNSVLDRTDSGYRPYEPKFVLREAGSKATSSLSSAISFGMITESATKALEIYNDGAAPLSIKSVTLPEGFTTDLDVTGEFVLERKTSKALNITLPTTNYGTFTGDLSIVYVNKDGEDTTLSLPLSGTVLGASTWFTTFDDPDSPYSEVYPKGSIAESAIKSDYSYDNGNRNYYLTSQTYTSAQDENNKFITPKLHANAGDVLSFDVARGDNNSDYYIKVYISTDRKSWGEPVASYTPADMDGTAFLSKSISFAQAGDYYVGFAIFGMKIDNLAGLEKIEVVHDIYIKSISQNETVQSGVQLTSSLITIPLKNEDSSAYTVKLYANGQEVATAESRSLTASATEETTFNARWTPEAEATTTIPTYFEITFTDGIKFISPVKNLTIECQPEFVFFEKGSYPTGTSYKPSSRTAPIIFGKINTPGIKQEFEIYNWGVAPLTIKSISLPNGFTASVTNAEGVTTPISEAVVPAKERQPIDVVLSATEAGEYSGNLTIVYVDANGADATFELSVSATLLDPAKWYASFDDGSATGVYPAGAVRQKNIELNNYGTYQVPNLAAYSSSSTNNIFITPKLHVAAAGETLSFDAKGNPSSYYAPKLNVYCAATREALDIEEERTLLGTFDSNSEDEATKLSDAFKTFTVSLPEAGDFYIGFELIERTFVDDIYGLSVAPVAHDLALASYTIPNGTQNTLATATLAVRNFGLAAEPADGYTLTAYVNGVAHTIAGNKEIPIVNTTDAAPTSLNIPFRSPKVGTFPVYLELKAGDFVLTTETQDVEFAKETLSSDIIVGTPTGTSAKVPLNLYFRNSETVALYTQEDLGLNGGEKIAKIAIKGFMKKEYTTDVKFYYQWTDDTEQTRPSSNDAFAYEDLGMTAVIDQAGYEWHIMGSEDNLVDIFTIQFPEPIAYESGKSLRLFIRSTWDDYAGNNQLKVESSDLKKNCYQHQNDGSKDVFTGLWSSEKELALPVLHIGLAVTPIALSGTVSDTEGNAAEGATVTLVSTDGDNIQYEATTDAGGAYNVDVIQSSRTYDVVVTKDGKEDYADAVEFPESKTADFTLYEVANLNDETNGVTAIESALVKIDLGLKPGFNAIALPVALTADEVAAIFGADAKVYEFVSVDGEIDALAHFFAKTDGMEAGVPYLLELAEAPVPFKVKGRAVVTDAPSVAHYAVDFTATYAPIAVTDGMFFLTADNYEATTAAATHGLSFTSDETVTTLPAFRAYVKQREGRELQTFRFDILTDYTGIEGVAADFDENAEIYNLQGIRVKNPARGGVYIVNGKKVLLK